MANRESGDRDVLIAWTNSAITDDTGRIVAVAAIGEDVTARREAEATQARLVAAIGQAAESIMVTDLQGRVVYANPAFEQMSGVAVADVMGKEPRNVVGGARRGEGLSEGRPPPPVRSPMERRMGPHQARRHVLSRASHDLAGPRARRPDRELRARGRDVTRLHEVQASLASTIRGREAFAHALARLQQRETLEETGQDITDAVGELEGVDVAVLLTFEIGRGRQGAGGDGARWSSAPVGESLPPAAAAYLVERAAVGPWARSPRCRSSEQRAGSGPPSG